MNTQEKLIEFFGYFPKKLYQKKGEVEFVIAESEHEIVTTIYGQVETTNTANAGDYVVKGVRGEYYVLTPEKFQKNYDVVVESTDYDPGKAKVKPQPRYVIQWKGEPFSFMAIWGEEMICNTDDYLVAPQDLSEVYRIEKNAFEQSYEPC